jgi:hypothetical protein
MQDPAGELMMKSDLQVRQLAAERQVVQSRGQAVQVPLVMKED